MAGPVVHAHNGVVAGSNPAGPTNFRSPIWRRADLDQLRPDLQLFIDIHNHAGRLKTLRNLTPHEFVIQQCTQEPKRSKTNPSNDTLIPNT